MNPTQGVLEGRINSLEGGCTTAVGLPGTLVVSSGQSAEILAILTLAETGSHVVSSPSLYGGTYNLFHYTLPKLGIEVTFVDDPDDLEEWRAAIRPNTKVFFGETMSNPKNDVFDIEGVSKVAHDHGIPLMIDNTVPTPYLIRPLEWGADIVVHSPDEVPRRPWHLDRRLDHGRRHVRLRRERALPELHRARPLATTASPTGLRSGTDRSS